MICLLVYNYYEQYFVVLDLHLHWTAETAIVCSIQPCNASTKLKNSNGKHSGTEAQDLISKPRPRTQLWGLYLCRCYVIVDPPSLVANASSPAHSNLLWLCELVKIYCACLWRSGCARVVPTIISNLTQVFIDNCSKDHTLITLLSSLTQVISSISYPVSYTHLTLPTIYSV